MTNDFEMKLPEQGEPIKSTTLSDVRQLVVIMNATQDEGVKNMLRVCIAALLDDYLNPVVVGEDHGFDAFRNGVNSIDKAVKMHALWVKDENPMISPILFKHIYDFIKEND